MMSQVAGESDSCRHQRTCIWWHQLIRGTEQLHWEK